MGVLRIVEHGEVDSSAGPYVGTMYRFGWRKAKQVQEFNWEGMVGTWTGRYVPVPAGWFVSVWYRGKFEDTKKAYLGQSYSTRAEAVDAAKDHATKAGIPFVEFSARPDPTADEMRKKRIRDGRRSILQWDYFAEQAEASPLGPRWRDAADNWARGAELCIEQIALEPHKARHFKRCATSRATEAIRCLKQLRIKLGSTKESAGLRLLNLPKPTLLEPTP